MKLTAVRPLALAKVEEEAALIRFATAAIAWRMNAVWKVVIVQTRYVNGVYLSANLPTGLNAFPFDRMCICHLI